MTYNSIRKVSHGKFSYSKNVFLKLREIADNTVGLNSDIYTFQLDSILYSIKTMDKQISLIKDKINEIIDLLNPRGLSIKRYWQHSICFYYEC